MLLIFYFIFYPQYSVREIALEKYKADYEKATDKIKESKPVHH